MVNPIPDFDHNLVLPPHMGDPRAISQLSPYPCTDHYPFDAGASPDKTVEYSRYWSLLFSHNRLGVWKGMLKIDLDTPADDLTARDELKALAP